MSEITAMQMCERESCSRPATWLIMPLGPGCSEFSCCGWEEVVCDEHKPEAMDDLGLACEPRAESLALLRGQG